MKKHRQKWNIIHSIKKHEHEQTRKRHRSHKKKHPKAQVIKGVKQNGEHWQETPIDAPATISLYDEKISRETLKAFNNCYKDSIANRIFKIDFSKTTLITLSGGIYLHGLVNYLKHKKVNYTISSLRAGKKIQQILQHVKVTDTNMKITHGDISQWHLISRKDKKTVPSREIGRIVDETQDLDPKKKEFIYNAIHETLQNCIRHPYNENDTFTNFYSFVGVSKEENGQEKLTICTYDHGKGFKKSYFGNQDADPNYKEKIKESLRLKLSTEGDIIKHIINQRESGTKRERRGNGLYNRLNDIKQNMKKGSILIYSRKGFYQYTTQDEKNETRTKLQGTLVQVSIPISDT